MVATMSEAIDQFFPDAPTRNFGPGEALFRAGDIVKSMFLVRSGRVDLVRHTAAGARMILHRASPGAILAEASAWSDSYHCDAVAMAPSEVAIVPRSSFRARLARDPALADLWSRSLARAVQAARLRAEIRSLTKVADRLDAWLGDGNTLPDKGHWQEVAAELSVSREALYRELSRRRMIERRA
jgi:CRP-like cAMP-binding protein